MSPLLSNILLDQLDKHLKGKGYRFIRYADDFSIYAKLKAEARKIGNEVYLFLRDKLELPINRGKSHRGPAALGGLENSRCWGLDSFPPTNKANGGNTNWL